MSFFLLAKEMVLAFVLGFWSYRLILRCFTQFIGNRYFVDIFAQELFYVVEAALVIQAYKGDGTAFSAGTGGTAYAVYVILGVLRNVKIDNQIYIIDVNAA